MKSPRTRTALLAKFKKQIARGEPLIGGGAGTGISAKSEELGGIDLLVVYNSGRYRMAGRGSLAGLMPYGNANQIVREMAYEILPVVKHTPVLAGVCATDPFILPRLLLEDLARLGYVGVQNFPTVGLVSGELRQALEETGMGFDKEVEMIALAREMDLLTTPYVFDTDEAERMARAGADIVVAHMGCTSGGTIGVASTKSLDECLPRIRAIAEAARAVRKDTIVLCHGGPLAEPSDAEYVLRRVPGIDGFYGASSMERLPTEIAIKEQVLAFKKLKLAPRKARSRRV